MDGRGATVGVGGTRAIGFEVARHYAELGDPVVVTGRDKGNVDAARIASGFCAGRPMKSEIISAMSSSVSRQAVPLPMAITVSLCS